MLELLQSVLALKARPPELPAGLVGRPLLAKRLTAATARPVTLVSAGPGTGKTFTVAAWAKSDDAPWPIAWLGLDASDNTVQSFWSSVLFTLSQCGGLPDDHGLRDITPAAAFGPEEVLAVRASLAELRRPIVLVLDDFHEVTDDRVLTSFGELVDHLPDSLRLVLVSRSDPVLRLHRLRASGHLTEFRTHDLTFSREETSALFEHAGVPLRGDQVEVLQDRTEGWPVGLRLAVLSLDRDDVDAAIHRLSGSDKAIADYLVGEVLQQLSSDHRDFLLKTSVVDRINGRLADQLTGRSDSHVLLENFARANAFVVGIGGNSGWFTYHRMLRELLLYRFALEQPEALRSAHGAAAQWFSANSDHVEAIRHFILAGDDEAAGRTLLRIIPKLLTPEGPAMAAAIAPLAAAAIENPCLATLLASAVCHYQQYEIAHMQRDVDDARQFLDEAGDARPGTEAALLLFDMAGRRSAADSVAVQSIAAQVTELVAGTPRRVLPAGPAFRVIAAINQTGAQIWTGATADTASVLADASQEAFELGLLLPQLNAIGHLALLDVFAGRYTSASRRAAEATEIIDRRGWGSEPQALATYLAQALIELARHRPTAAGQHIRRGLASSGQHTDRALRIALGIAWVEANVGRGDARAAIAADSRVVDGIERTPAAPAALRRWAAAAGAEALLSAGEPEKARARLGVQPPMESPNGDSGRAHSINGHSSNGRATNTRAGKGHSTNGHAANGRATGNGHPGSGQATIGQEPAELTPRERICLARAAIAQGNTGIIPTLIEPLLSRTGPDKEATIAAHLLQSVLADRSHRDTVAFSAMETAVDLAYAEGIRRPFVSVGDRVPTVLARYRHTDGRHDSFTRELGPLLEMSPTAATDDGAVTERLTDREAIVLRYLPTMLKAGEIADDLFVSVNTVKAHLRAIYRKLGVANRREAVEKARATGLL